MLNTAVNSFLRYEIFQKNQSQGSGIPAPKTRIHKHNNKYVEISSGVRRDADIGTHLESAKAILKFLQSKHIKSSKITQNGRQVSVDRAEFIRMLKKETFYGSPRFSDQDLAGLEGPSLAKAMTSAGTNGIFHQPQGGAAGESNNTTPEAIKFCWEELKAVARNATHLLHHLPESVTYNVDSDEFKAAREQAFLQYYFVKALDGMFLNQYPVNLRHSRMAQALNNHPNGYFMLWIKNGDAQELPQPLVNAVRDYLESQRESTTSGNKTFKHSFLVALRDQATCEPFKTILRNLPDCHFTDNTLKFMPELATPTTASDELPSYDDATAAASASAAESAATADASQSAETTPDGAESASHTISP